MEQFREATADVSHRSIEDTLDEVRPPVGFPTSCDTLLHTYLHGKKKLILCASLESDVT